MTQNVRTGVSITATTLGLLATIYGLALASSGSRDIGPIESIYGIPYPKESGNVRILEPLAHVDVFLHEPVLAKQLVLAVTFRPGNISSLAVGVRENAFWLSYKKIDLWNSGDNREVQTRTVTIPLTDKFQETDQSIDVMFFAEGSADNIDWAVQSLTASVQPTVPTFLELKDYARSVLRRERAL